MTGRVLDQKVNVASLRIEVRGADRAEDIEPCDAVLPAECADRLQMLGKR